MMVPNDHNKSAEDQDESFANFSMGSAKFDTESQMHLPFELLPGEILSKSEPMAHVASIGITNYRLIVQVKESSAMIPLGVIEQPEQRDGYLNLYCKDAKTYRCKFDNAETLIKWFNIITAAINLPHRNDKGVFAYAFYNACKLNNEYMHSALEAQSYSYESVFDSEMKRLDYNLQQEAWRVSNLNKNYEFCSSYPQKLIIPASINDNDLQQVAQYRFSKRIPTAIWRHSNGAVVARCSQPEVGWLGWRSTPDENLVKAISEACSLTEDNLIDTGRTRTISDSSAEPLCVVESLGQVKKCLIVDARSYSVAFANRVRGGGVECQEYYENSEVQFMNLANIHIIKKSHGLLRQLFTLGDSSSSSWLANLDYSKWLAHISGIVKSGSNVARTVACEARPVLVHCSDGWDRTPQITALAQLLMDPYYRTIDGFKVLVEKDWIAFGHKFRERCATGVSMGMSTNEMSERSPIFLQWLECVHCVTVQFPTAFEFNETYLIKLAQHTYSNLFGNFLFNSPRERHDFRVEERTYSVWSLFQMNKAKFTNVLYQPVNSTLYPSHMPQDLYIWKGFYEMDRNILSDDVPDEKSQNQVEKELAEGLAGLPKTKSCENLASSSYEDTNPILRVRRSSDPNLCKNTPIASTPSKSTQNHMGMMKIPSDPLVHRHSIPLDFYDNTVPDADEDSQPFEARDLPLSMSQELAQSMSCPAGSETKSGASSSQRRLSSRKSLDDSDLEVAKPRCKCNKIKPVELGLDVAKFLDFPVKSASSGGARASSPSSPGHSRSSSSGIPSSPTEDRNTANLDKTLGLQSVDGLRTPIENEATKRIQEMITNYQMEVETLRKSLQYTKDCHQQLIRTCLYDDEHSHDQLSLPDSSSLVSLGSNADQECGSLEHIWDVLDPDEARPTLWVPDFTSSHCEGCQNIFWMGRRKHHCRSCGKIFCAACSDKSVPVPKENLLDPVRVCSECFKVITDERNV